MQKIRYTKEQIIDSKKFERYRDFLCGNLSNNVLYTISEIESFINKSYGKKRG